MAEPSATLLVVDDDENNRDILARRLERKGYHVLAAPDGQSCLEIVRREPVDLILLDIMMPGLTGIEVLRILRQDKPASLLPIIMATAKSGSEDVVEALEAGANDYVTKPLDFPIVLARIEAQLRLKQAAARAAAPAPAPPAPDTGREVGPGLVLAEKYKLESRIGSGNFGTVFRARHLGLDSPVAVKVLQTQTQKSPDALARFQREGISACRIRHPNAVLVHDFGVTPDGIAFLVMELLEGRSLDTELKMTGRVALKRTAQILVPICGVLAEAHRAGVIHRDIKPANIFLNRTDRGEIVKVLDFGIAKIAGEAMMEQQRLTMDGWIIGTPAYMAPERLQRGAYGGAADVYSLGCMLFEMLTGRLPFVPEQQDPMAMVTMHIAADAPSPRQFNPELPAAIEQVVLQTLRKDPKQRPSPEELAWSFAQAAGLPAELVGAVPPPRPGALAQPDAREEWAELGTLEIRAGAANPTDAIPADPDAATQEAPVAARTDKIDTPTAEVEVDEAKRAKDPAKGGTGA